MRVAAEGWLSQYLQLLIYRIACDGTSHQCSYDTSSYYYTKN